MISSEVLPERAFWYRIACECGWTASNLLLYEAKVKADEHIVHCLDGSHYVYLEYVPIYRQIIAFIERPEEKKENV